MYINRCKIEPSTVSRRNVEMINGDESERIDFHLEGFRMSKKEYGKNTIKYR